MSMSNTQTTTRTRPPVYKPIGRKAYGSIGHLPNSRLGPKDHSIPEGQARIATEKARDQYDQIIVQEKLDGSCVAAVRMGNKIVALGRAGYPAETSPFPQHHLFADWVKKHAYRFMAVLHDGERLVGEWLAQAHGTIYHGIGKGSYEPFVAFDLMTGTKRVPFDQFHKRVVDAFDTPAVLHVGGPLSVIEAVEAHVRCGRPCDEIEGVVYRVERKGEVEFLCKWVQPKKVDGKWLPEISGQPPVWNWRP